MKKIAILGHSLGGGGVEKVIVNLTKGLVQNNCSVHIILLSNVISYDFVEATSIDILESNSIICKISQIRPYFYARQIKELIKKYEIELLISNFTDFYGMKIVDLVNFDKTITIVHNTQSKRRFKRHKKSGTFLKKFKQKRIENSFNNKNLVCVSDGVKNDLLTNFQITPKKIVTIYNPFDINEIKLLSENKNRKIPEERYIIHVGRFELVHKRQDLLLKAYKKSNIEEKLVLLGDGGDRKEIELLVNQLKLETKVILAGFDKNPYPWISNAKLFVFTSDYEGLPMVLVESLILNTPVVSTNCPSGPSEILIDELSQYLVPVGDIDMIANKIREALEYYPEILPKYYDNFIEKTIAKKYLDFFNDS